jgi:hypothetical protein
MRGDELLQHVLVDGDGHVSFGHDRLAAFEARGELLEPLHLPLQLVAARL